MLLHLLLLHLLLLLDDQRRVLGRRDNLTDLGFQLRRPPFQLIGIAVPRALSPESNDGSAIPAGSLDGQGHAVSYLAAVIGPLQQGLPLPGPTKPIAWFAIRSHLRNVAPK
jgi:hypothetical protein